MATNWYYGVAGQQNGPVDDNEMRALIASGRINTQTIIWCEGMDEWKPLGEVPQWAAQVVTPQPSPYASPQAPGQVTPHPGMLPTAPNNGMAIASLVCGISSIVLMFSCLLGIVAGIPGAICGHIALKQINESATPMAGRGMAIAGLVTSYLTILGSVCIGVFFGVMIARDI